jgi:hypothetical protein
LQVLANAEDLDAKLLDGVAAVADSATGEVDLEELMQHVGPVTPDWVQSRFWS